MCEILLCVKNETPTGNLNWDSKRPQQGDVIAAVPDGWTWGNCELGQIVPGNPNGNHPQWRLIALPNVTFAQAQASGLLDAEVDVSAQNPSPYLQFRGHYLDKSKIPPATMQALLDHWNDDTRANGIITLNYKPAQIASIISARTPVPF